MPHCVNMGVSTPSPHLAFPTPTVGRRVALALGAQLDRATTGSCPTQRVLQDVRHLLLTAMEG